MTPQTTPRRNRAFFVLCLCLLPAAFFFSSGCATVARGGGETLLVQSEPSGAEVKLSTGQAGITPFSTPIKRKEGTIFVTVSKKGYKELKTAVIPSIDGGSLGLGTVANLLFLPIVNDIVDYNTKANYSHKPNPLMVTLIPLDSDQNYNLVAPPGTSGSQAVAKSADVQSGKRASVADGSQPAVRQDISQAETLQAAQAGDAVMQFNVAMNYAHGTGVEVDKVEAVKWYRKSAEQGHAPAQANLAFMYANGEGVPRDYVQAHLWWNIARVQGLREAKVSLDALETEMTAEQKAQALKLARAQLEKLNKKSANALER